MSCHKTDEEELYALMQDVRQQQHVDLSALENQLLYYSNRQSGRDVHWFQSIIPELVPGAIEDFAPWVFHTRELLWNDHQQMEHKRKCTLRQKNPDPLPADKYNLRHHFPAYIEALRPMPIPLLRAANRVYQIVAGRECLHDDRNTTRVSEKMDHKHNHFIIAAQATQEKLVGPMINELKELKEALQDVEGEIESQKKGMRQCNDEEDKIKIQDAIAKLNHEKQELEAERRDNDEELTRALELFLVELIQAKEDYDGLETRSAEIDSDIESGSIMKEVNPRKRKDTGMIHPEPEHYPKSKRPSLGDIREGYSTT